jgi:predicted 3-demethylubiquinone-9 3-methyltransferase (glyoxalase superfamily)
MARRWEKREQRCSLRQEQDPDTEGAVRRAHFSLLGQEFGATDSAWAHQFAFNEAISFMVPCNSQG